MLSENGAKNVVVPMDNLNELQDITQSVLGNTDVPFLFKLPDADAKKCTRQTAVNRAFIHLLKKTEPLFRKEKKLTKMRVWRKPVLLFLMS